MENNIVEDGEYVNNFSINNNKLIHIANVTELYKIIKDEEQHRWNYKSKNKFKKQKKKSPVVVRGLKNIDVHDFDKYINYITKINIIKDVDDQVSVENDFNTFEKTLQNPYNYIQIELSSTKARKKDILKFDKLDKYSKKDYNVFLDEENVECNISSMLLLQQQLNEDLDKIESFMSTQISEEIKEYFNITKILINMKNSIEHLHNEIQIVKEYLKKFKEALINMKELYSFKKLKIKYEKIENILQAFIYFHNLMNHLKYVIQSNQKFNESVYLFNKIVKFYASNKDILKYEYFKYYSSNFNFGYLKKVISRKFILTFYYYSLLFIFPNSKNAKKKSTKEDDDRKCFTSDFPLSSKKKRINPVCLCHSNKEYKNKIKETSCKKCKYLKEMGRFVKAQRKINKFFMYIYYYTNYYYCYMYKKRKKSVRHITHWNGSKLAKRKSKRKKSFFRKFQKFKKRRKKKKKKKSKNNFVC